MGNGFLWIFWKLDIGYWKLGIQRGEGKGKYIEEVPLNEIFSPYNHNNNNSDDHDDYYQFFMCFYGNPEDGEIIDWEFKNTRESH